MVSCDYYDIIITSYRQAVHQRPFRKYLILILSRWITIIYKKEKEHYFIHYKMNWISFLFIIFIISAIGTMVENEKRNTTKDP